MFKRNCLTAVQFSFFVIAGLFFRASWASESTEPQIFLPGVVSSPDHHEGMHWIDSDGDSLLFTRADPDFSTSTIFQAEKLYDEWRIAPVSFSSNGGYDAGASFSANAESLIFTSTRAIDQQPKGNWNIWQVPVLGLDNRFKFGNARPLPDPINTQAAECCAVFIDNDRFLFSSDRDGTWDIYLADVEGENVKVTALTDSINTAQGEWPSAISYNGSLLLLSSIRPNGRGGDDIYISKQLGDSWSCASILPAPINSTHYEDSAFVANDRFFWSSRRVEGGAGSKVSNVFHLPISEVELLLTAMESEPIVCQNP